MSQLTEGECEEVAELLSRRANEVATFAEEYRRDPKHYGSVELALTREIARLRELSNRVMEAMPKALPGSKT